jgi:Rieske Fe-S protein
MAERDHPVDTGPSRRNLLLGAGAAGAAALLAACSTDGSAGTPGATAPEPPLPPPPDTTGAGVDNSRIHTTDIPLGGGLIFTTLRTVVTQPTAGSFRAFDATCKHQGCIVGAIENGFIICPCHGSKYRITDGAVVNGPATTPLDPKMITVTGDIITVN